MNASPKSSTNPSAFAGRWIAGLTLAGAALGAGGLWGLDRLEHKPRQGETLAVGYLPVTCHLTCPVTDYASQTSVANRFVSQRFQDWPSVAEAFKSGRIEASFFIAPLAMKLVEQGLPAKIVYLGHRDGSTLMVGKNSDIHRLEDLRGRKVAIPSRFSNQNLVLRKVLADHGVPADSLNFVELAPPEMPAALAVGAIDAYFVGEPHAARAELDGTGRVLMHAKDMWPGFISCVLVVSQKLIDEKPWLVRDLVRGIAESGEWIEDHREEAAKVAAPYFKQDEKLLRYVLTQPPDRVSYAMLIPKPEEIALIRDMAVEAGILAHDVPVDDLLDLRFLPTKKL